MLLFISGIVQDDELSSRILTMDQQLKFIIIKIININNNHWATKTPFEEIPLALRMF